jgi:hypothetical protein
MTSHHHFPQTDLLLVMPNDLTIAAIAKELDILKLKLRYAAENLEFIDDRQELSYYLNTLVRDLNIINRQLPPLPQEMEIFDIEPQP